MQENSFQENLFGHDTATIGTQAFHHWLSWVLSIFSRQFVFFVNGFDSFVDFYQPTRQSPFLSYPPCNSGHDSSLEALA
jgi:hypothetical protein